MSSMVFALCTGRSEDQLLSYLLVGGSRRYQRLIPQSSTGCCQCMVVVRLFDPDEVIISMSCARSSGAKERLCHRKEILQSCFTHALGTVEESAII
jgi:hypothetical protein